MSRSRSSSSKSQKLDLNLSLPIRGGSSRFLDEDISSPSSCLTSETDLTLRGGCLNSPEATSMVLSACPRCLMYVMLSETDPKCPKCKSPVILDFLQGKGKAAAVPTPTSNNKRTRKS